MAQIFQCDIVTCKSISHTDLNKVEFQNADDGEDAVIHDVCDKCFASMQEPFKNPIVKEPDQQPELAQEPSMSDSENQIQPQS